MDHVVTPSIGFHVKTDVDSFDVDVNFFDVDGTCVKTLCVFISRPHVRVRMCTKDPSYDKNLATSS